MRIKYSLMYYKNVQVHKKGVMNIDNTLNFLNPHFVCISLQFLLTYTEG